MASLTKAKRVVIKVGSTLLVDKNSGDLNLTWLESLASDVSSLKSRGIDVVLVSSGSIALGRGSLGLQDAELSLENSQASAAVGQIRLARAYEEVLAPFSVKTAQILVTLEDSANRRRYLNTRATMERLLTFGVVPIVNENDTVATDEIRFGDNDRLAAQIAATVSADNLILLSDVDGLYSSNPSTNPDAKRLDVIKEITPEIEEMAGEGVSGISKGGMITKLMAARTATQAGCAMVITKGDVPNPITELENGANCTWFKPNVDPQTARKRWISSQKSVGKLIIDQGAVTALIDGKSLLPIGVISIEGNFSRGDVVSIYSTNGRELAKGICAYPAVEAKLIIGQNSNEIETILGYAGRAAVIHRDDLAI
jgi:glutamate 5-kinase